MTYPKGGRMPVNREPLHSHVSKAAKAWKAAHLKHTERADKATLARDQQMASDKAASDLNNQRKGNE